MNLNTNFLIGFLLGIVIIVYAISAKKSEVKVKTEKILLDKQAYCPNIINGTEVSYNLVNVKLIKNDKIFTDDDNMFLFDDCFTKDGN